MGQAAEEIQLFDSQLLLGFHLVQAQFPLLTLSLACFLSPKHAQATGRSTQCNIVLPCLRKIDRVLEVGGFMVNTNPNNPLTVF